MTRIMAFLVLVGFAVAACAIGPDYGGYGYGGDYGGFGEGFGGWGGYGGGWGGWRHGWEHSAWSGSNSNWSFGCISFTVRVGPRRGAAVLSRSGSA